MGSARTDRSNTARLLERLRSDIDGLPLMEVVGVKTLDPYELIGLDQMEEPMAASVREQVRLWGYHNLPDTLEAYTVQASGWTHHLTQGDESVRLMFDPGVEHRGVITDGMLDEASRQFREAFIDVQAVRRDDGARRGLASPAEPESIRHLDMDADMLAFADSLTGGRDATIAMLEGRLAAREARMSYTTLSMTVCLDPLQFGIPADIMRRSMEAGPMINLSEDGGISKGRSVLPPLWHGNAIELPREFPDTIGVVLPGRRVRDVMAGTPVGHRVIESAGLSGGSYRLKLDKRDVRIVP